jgi:hypothetical protein
MRAGRSELALFQRPHPKRQMRKAVLWIGAHKPLGQRKRLRHVAIGQRSDESALQKHCVARVSPQGLPEKDSGGARITLRARHERRQIIA